MQKPAKSLYFTNNFTLPPIVITELYRNKWQVELFFKWIKQNLKIKAFYGTTQNAVLMQLWTALIYYLIAAFIRFMNKCRHSMLHITRLIKEQLFAAISLDELLNPKPPSDDYDIQMSLNLTGHY